MPPPWDLCLFAPGGGPELGAVTPKFITRPQTRHRRGSGLSYRPVMPADFKAETYVETPRNGRFPGFRGSGPTFWGSRARNPGIRGPGPGNPWSGRPGNGDPGSKKSRTGTPLPGTVRSEGPQGRRSGVRKKSRSDPQKKVIPQKKETGTHYKPPPAYNNRSQLRVKRKYRSDSQGGSRRDSDGGRG